MMDAKTLELLRFYKLEYLLEPKKPEPVLSELYDRHPWRTGILFGLMVMSPIIGTMLKISFDDVQHLPVSLLEPVPRGIQGRALDTTPAPEQVLFTDGASYMSLTMPEDYTTRYTFTGSDIVCFHRADGSDACRTPDEWIALTEER